MEKILFPSTFPSLSFIRKRQDKIQNKLIVYQYMKKECTYIMERKTPLYDCHVALGGKIVPFGGFLLPVQYPTGVIAEHLAVENKPECSMYPTWLSCCSKVPMRWQMSRCC